MDKSQSTNGARPLSPGDPLYRQFGAHRVTVTQPPQPALAGYSTADLEDIYDDLVFARHGLEPFAGSVPHPQTRIVSRLLVALDVSLTVLYRELARSGRTSPPDVPPGVEEADLAGLEADTRDRETELERRAAWGDR